MEDTDRFKKVTELIDTEYRILESIRFRDNDQSVKSGAVLAFSGLMIATSIVQLSTSPDAVVHVGSDQPVLLVLNIFGLVLLFVSSIITILALISSGNYPIDKNKALLAFDDYVIKKAKKVKVASLFTACGSSSVLVALMFQILKKLIF